MPKSNNAKVVRALYRSLAQAARLHDRNPALKALLRLDDPLCRDCRNDDHWDDEYRPLGTILASNKNLHKTALKFLNGVSFRPNSNNSLQGFVSHEFRSCNHRPIAEARSEGFEALALLNKNIQDAKTLKLLEDSTCRSKPQLPPPTDTWFHLDRPEEGCVLVANPIQICDQLARSVVVLLRHDGASDGSLGLVANKATPLTLLDLVHYLGGKRIAMGVLSNNTVHDGGPIRTPLLALHPFAELVREDEDIDPVAKIQRDALDAHAEKTEIRQGTARCGIGTESDNMNAHGSHSDEGSTSENNTEQATSTSSPSVHQSLHVSVVDDEFLERVAEMVAEGRAEAFHFKLMVGCVVWKKDQLTSEWDRNYWYGADSSDAARVGAIGRKQLVTSQYAHGAKDDTVEDIARAGALLKMRRMVGGETVKMMLLGAPSTAKFFLGCADEGEEQKAKTEYQQFWNATIENKASLPFTLQKDLHELPPSEVMADPEGIRDLEPRLSWDRLMKLCHTKAFFDNTRSRWEIVSDALGTSSGEEDEPRCEEDVWAALLQSMGGEYASLAPLASKLSTQEELYYSRLEDTVVDEDGEWRFPC